MCSSQRCKNIVYKKYFVSKMDRRRVRVQVRTVTPDRNEIHALLVCSLHWSDVPKPNGTLLRSHWYARRQRNLAYVWLTSVKQIQHDIWHSYCRSNSCNFKHEQAIWKTTSSNLRRACSTRFAYWRWEIWLHLWRWTFHRRLKPGAVQKCVYLLPVDSCCNACEMKTVIVSTMTQY